MPEPNKDIKPTENIKKIELINFFEDE